MKSNSAFTGLHTERPLCYQQFHVRQFRILKGCQPFVDFVAVDNCCLYVTTMKAMNIQDDIPPISIDPFTDHYVIVCDLTSMQGASEKSLYPELVGGHLSSELNFTFPQEHVTEIIVLGERKPSVAVNTLVLVRGKV